MTHLLSQLLSASARRQPDRLAVVHKAASITYGELDALSDRLAGVLAEHGVGRGDRVGIFLNKSIEAIAGIFGILKAGGVYVPIDAKSPARRAAYIMNDCGIRHLVTAPEKLTDLRENVAPDDQPRFAAAVVVGDASASEAVPNETAHVISWGDVRACDAPAPPVDSITTDLAYILYTSGSTGAPKGVMISHLASLTFVNWAAERFELTPEDRVSNHAPLHFDLSTFDIFATLKTGGAVHLVPEHASTFPVTLTKFIVDNRITVWYSVPSALILLLTRGRFSAQEYPHLRTILFAGEVFPVKYLRELRRCVKARLFNLYGPTETNVCTFHEVTDIPDDRTEPFPIGKSITNHDVFAVTEDGNIAGVGELGELYDRGPGLMSGYWGDCEKTAHVLHANPFQKDFDEKVYRTGDLVRLDEDGNYLYAGRVDNMVKSRGYRIELGEIEAALYSHPKVREAVVIAIPDEEVTNRLVGFLVWDEPEPPSAREVLAYCAQRVPNYMVPETLEFRDTLPKTGTGKIDRKALP